MSKQEFNDKQGATALSFFKNFIKYLSRGRFEIIHFGWWPTGKGRYGLSMYWNNVDEIEE